MLDINLLERIDESFDESTIAIFKFAFISSKDKSNIMENIFFRGKYHNDNLHKIRISIYFIMEDYFYQHTNPDYM